MVLTSVDSYDLPDAGAAHIAQTIKQLKLEKPSLLVECLSPDFAGDQSCVEAVATSGLDVFPHNIETVKRLSHLVRDIGQT